jgi:hypothetical protein
MRCGSEREKLDYAQVTTMNLPSASMVVTSHESDKEKQNRRRLAQDAREKIRIKQLTSSDILLIKILGVFSCRG